VFGGGHVYPNIPVEKVVFFFFFLNSRKCFLLREKRQEDNNDGICQVQNFGTFMGKCNTLEQFK
jgi:hypothetical protein